MGCVWGGRLVALRLEDEKYFSVPSRRKADLDGSLAKTPSTQRENQVNDGKRD